MLRCGDIACFRNEAGVTFEQNRRRQAGYYGEFMLLHDANTSPLPAYYLVNFGIRNIMTTIQKATQLMKEKSFLCNVGALGVSGSIICCLSPSMISPIAGSYGIAEQRHVPNLPCSNRKPGKMHRTTPRSTSQVPVALPNRSNNARKKKKRKQVITFCLFG